MNRQRYHRIPRRSKLPSVLPSGQLLGRGCVQIGQRYRLPNTLSLMLHVHVHFTFRRNDFRENLLAICYFQDGTSSLVARLQDPEGKGTM